MASVRLLGPGTLIVVVLAATRTAAAAEDPARPDKEAELSLYAGLGRRAGWIFASAGAAMWFFDHLTLGVYLDVALFGDTLEADCSNVFCAQQEYKIGSRARWHVAPTFIIDPWVGVGIGGHFDDSRTKTVGGIDGSASVGADVRLGRVTLGPFGFIDQPLTQSDVWSGWQGQVGLGLRGAYAF
jgi:hypothetical protein